MNDWIRTKDRLPNDKTEFFKGGPEGSHGCSVLMAVDKYNFEIVYFDGDDNKFWNKGKVVELTQWLPIPKPSHPIG